jgi:hypothetical protein
MSLQNQIPSKQLQFNVEFFEENFKVRYVEDINKLSGSRKFRRYFVPSEPVRIIHKEIIEKLKKVLASRMKTSSGSYMDASPFRNLLKHRLIAANRKQFFPRYWYIVDFKDAYESATDVKVMKAFKDYLKDSDLPDRIKNYCFTPEGQLITGANASPIIFYGYCEITIDEPLRELCRDSGMTYSRYFDDLVFSSREPVDKAKKQAILKIIREKGGFEISHKKVRHLDLAKGPIMLNGYSIEHKNGEQRIFLPKKHLVHLKGLLWSALKGNNPPRRSMIVAHMSVFLHLVKERGYGFTVLERQVNDLWNEYRVKGLKAVAY